ncbi:MAG: NAD(P)/FAD-dependent oxidoreductase [Pseudomonadota bacterium]|nr:NAD(P)/FAD-dependent oxidoreductase [Pseudomonadota bacterium]
MKRAVIIGSGMGGLTSAILLAKAGWQVTVLEQHTRAGGFLHRFFRRGVGYDTGFHYVGGARPDQLFGRAMKHLGVYDQVNWHPLDPDGFDILRFPDLDFRVPVGVDRYRDRLVEYFPEERAGIDRYIALTREAVHAYGWFNLDETVPPEAILPYEQMSVLDVTRACFKDPRLTMVVAGQAALYGVSAAEAPFGLHAIVTDHFLQSATSIEGGGDRLAFALVRRLKALGGTVRLKRRAVSIDVRDGAACGVTTAEGEHYEADLVLANVHPRACLDMLPAGSVRPAYAARVRDSRAGLAHLGVYLRVEGDLELVGNRNLYRFNSWSLDTVERPATATETPFYFLTCPGQRHPAPVPGADQVVLGLVYAEYDKFLEAKQRSDGDYRAYKQGIADRFVETIQADFPGWKVVDQEASTPLTTEHFNGAYRGAAYGHLHSVAQMGRYRLPMVSKVRGLVNVGQTVGFPGICGAMMSAYVVCGELLGGSAQLMREMRAT